MFNLPGNTIGKRAFLKGLWMESFDQLAEQYEPMIWKILQSLHIYKNQDEFYQVALIALWEAYERFNPEKGSFTNYAYTFIKGRVMSAMTNSNKYENNCFYPEEEFWSVLEDSAPLQVLEEDMIKSYCVDLTENQKKWVLYSIFDGLQIREIAQIEKVSISTVKGWKKGAKMKIKQTINSIIY